jgi:hypothetical protein
VKPEGKTTASAQELFERALKKLDAFEAAGGDLNCTLFDLSEVLGKNAKREDLRCLTHTGKGEPTLTGLLRHLNAARNKSAASPRDN